MNILADCTTVEETPLFLRKRVNSPSTKEVRPTKSPRCQQPPKISLKTAKTLKSRHSLQTIDSDGPMTPSINNIDLSPKNVLQKVSDFKNAVNFEDSTRKKIIGAF